MKNIVMIGTNPAGNGGVASVIRTYIDSGLFAEENINYLSSHVEGTVLYKIFTFFKALASFFVLCALQDVKMVHLQTASYGSFYRKFFFFAIAKTFRLKIIVHVHGAEFEVFYRERSNFLVKKMIEIFLKKSDVVIALSSEWRNKLESIGGGDNVIVVYNPVLVPVVSSGQRDSSTLLFLGHIGERKGIFDLIRALPALTGDFPDLTLLIGGSGELSKAERLANELGVLGHIKFLGWVTGEEKIDLLNSSTLLILPSYNEGLPISILEAMAYGLPVVASNVGGIPELLAKFSPDCIVVPGDDSMLALKIRLLLTNKEKLDQIGLSNKNDALMSFDANVVKAKLCQIYRSLE